MRAALATACVLALAVAADQQVSFQSKRKELKGRFLHITDIHPDPHYVTGGSFDSACHRRKGKTQARGQHQRRLDDVDGGGGNDDVETTKSGAGRWGDAISDCDASMDLVDLVFDWLKKEWADEIDFVLWTGDNARHDSDRSIPRTPKEIFDLNRLVSDKMISTFGKHMPIVPALGNNDIWPHNIMSPGPNRVTEQFLRIWKPFIPEDERHIFERGAHFTREVIPDRLAVISLNTIYWFASNSAVDGCQTNSNEPGALQMDWLEVQLDMFRERGMQVWLIGHVPPHDGLYYDNCYLRYGDLSLRYQDTIVGHLFGHQNIDHFFFLDVKDLNAKSVTKPKKHFGPMYFNIVNDTEIDKHSVEDFTFFGPELPDGRPHLLHSGRFKVLGQKGDLLKKSLMESFEGLEDPDSFKHKDYTVMNVGPSVLPAYVPSARIFSYNISGVELDHDADMRILDLARWRQSQDPVDMMSDSDDEEDNDAESVEGGKKDCKKPSNEDKPRCTFKRKPRYSSPESPSRTNKPLTPLGYTQFFLPDLDKKKAPEFKVEYTTFKPKALLPEHLSGEEHSQPPPVPYHLLPGWDSSIGKLTPEDVLHLDSSEDEESDEIDIDDNRDDDESPQRKGKGKKNPKTVFLKEIKRITPYKMKDLTINSYVKLGRALLADKKLWSKFVDYMFVSSGGE